MKRKNYTPAQVEKLAKKLNREASSKEFRPFFMNLDRKRARQILKGVN